uniref:Uncharacterized protein n=1 Tax=Arundo donax TaxID=35708 RepID=A0A0A8ZHD2_ARUDO
MSCSMHMPLSSPTAWFKILSESGHYFCKDHSELHFI